MEYKIDPSRFYRYQAPMLPLAEQQQYVVGRIIKGELYLLENAHPPVIRRVSGDAEFRVFALSDINDMQVLASIWHHTTKYHEAEKRLELYTLAELGVDLSPLFKT